MYSLPRHHYIQKSLVTAQKTPTMLALQHQVSHEERVRGELRKADMSWFGLRTLEGRYLPELIHPDEQIGGVVYGFHDDGFALLVATDCRVIFLDRKPLFTNMDEINYYVVGGVNFTNSGLLSAVTLHTRIQDYTIKTFNNRAAHLFVEYIEARALEHKVGVDEYNK